MNIAFNTLVENPDKPTGSTVFFQKILAELQRLDHVNQYYVLVSARNRRYFELQAANFHYVDGLVSHERRLLQPLVSQAIIPWRLWQHHIDVYFSPMNMSPFLTLSRAAVVVYLYGTHHWQSANGMGAAKTLYRRGMARLARRQATLLLANSTACRRDILHHLSLPEARVRVVSEAYDHHLFNRRELSDADHTLLAKHGLRAGEYILFVSHIHAYKSVHTLVEAFGRLSQRLDRPYRLALIGRIDVAPGRDGTYRDRLERVAQEYGVGDRLSILGPIPHDRLFPFYRGAALCVQPSLYETFGKTVVEAMACGTPVIGAAAGATPEVMGGAGLLYRPGDAEDLCGQMCRLLADDDLYRACVRDGLAHACQYTFERQAAGLLEAFEAAARQKGLVCS